MLEATLKQGLRELRRVTLPALLAPLVGIMARLYDVERSGQAPQLQPLPLPPPPGDAAGAASRLLPAQLSELHQWLQPQLSAEQYAVVGKALVRPRPPPPPFSRMHTTAGSGARSIHAAAPPPAALHCPVRRGRERCMVGPAGRAAS